jgi:ribulose-5-phosphate 4-epimerase/fuculose-1-phosphate aldolase
LAGHGLYAFGPDANAALRHVEALDALFRTQLALKGIPV